MFKISENYTFKSAGTSTIGQWVNVKKETVTCIDTGHTELKHWGRVMHLCINIDKVIIGSGYGLSSVQHQAIT